MRGKRLRRSACLMAICLAALCAFSPACRAASQDRVSGTGYFFDTVVTVTLYGAPEGLMDEIWASCGAYERLLSKTVSGSDVDRINQAHGETVTVSADTWDILSRALEVSRATGGAFSVTIAPVTALWDFTRGTHRKPSADELAAALPLVADDRLQLGEGYTVTLPDGMQVDLGGIAKGYIADRIAEKVRGRVTAAVLNFGGNVYTVGRKSDGSAFRVAVRDPQSEAEEGMLVLSVGDTSVVTSGTYERFFIEDGVKYHHILDPVTGYPAASDLDSATVICESSMTADAYATACIVLGSEKALQLLEDQGLPGLLITKSGEVLTTAGFEDMCPIYYY